METGVNPIVLPTAKTIVPDKLVTVMEAVIRDTQMRPVKQASISIFKPAEEVRVVFFVRLVFLCL